MIRVYIQGDPRKWEAIIPPLLFLVGEAPQVSTGCIPFELVYEHKSQGLLDIICEGRLEKVPGEICQPHPVQEFQERLGRVRNLLQENLGKSQVRQKQWYDEHARNRKFKEGYWVLLMLPENNHKLLSRWQGPFHLTHRLGPVNNEVQWTEPVKRRQNGHVNLLKKWHN